MKNTKILVTYGPAISSALKINNLVEAGSNAFRINCSHSTSRDFLKAARLFRQSTKDLPFTIGLGVDISGTELRFDRFKSEYHVKQGQTIRGRK